MSITPAHSADPIHNRTAAAAAWAKLAPALAGTLLIRLSEDGGRTYPRGNELGLTRELPSLPATIDVYQPIWGTGRLIVADFDTSKAPPGAPDDAAAVDDDAAAFAALIAQCGGRTIADTSISGGRHVYVLFADPLPWRELADVARALARRYPTCDPKPHLNKRGQIRPPGSPHPRGGWQALTTPLDAAQSAVEHPCGPEVWTALLDALQGELAATAPIATPFEASPRIAVDVDGEPYVPRGGRTPLRQDLAAIARNGIDGTRFSDRSVARRHVLASAAMRGWTLADVHDAIATGEWAGFANLYYRHSEPSRIDRLLPAEWQKTVADVSQISPAGNVHTSDASITRPPATTRPIRDTATERTYGHIRLWVTAADIALADPPRRARWGRLATPVRQVLAALGQAAMVAGSEVLEFGVRNLALHSAQSASTTAAALAVLRNDPSPLIDLVTPRRLKRADRYQLVIPAEYLDRAQWRRRRAGRIDAIHRAFTTLGGTAAFVHQALTPADTPVAELARVAHFTRDATTTALQLLGEYGLAERGRHGWHIGPEMLDQAAADSGADDLFNDRRTSYLEDRAEWHAHLVRYLPGPSRIPIDPSPPPAIDDILGQLMPPP